MKNNSRIRFNPVTKEIEIEGTEEFVKTYFGKIRELIFGHAEKKEPGTKKVTNIDSVVGIIQASREGVSTAELKEKTGLAERQIWSIVNRAKRNGKIRKTKRGLYSAL